jgi:hypothetical protein
MSGHTATAAAATRRAAATGAHAGGAGAASLTAASQDISRTQFGTRYTQWRFWNQIEPLHVYLVLAHDAGSEGAFADAVERGGNLGLLQRQLPALMQGHLLVLHRIAAGKPAERLVGGDGLTPLREIGYLVIHLAFPAREHLVVLFQFLGCYHSNLS